MIDFLKRYFFAILLLLGLTSFSLAELFLNFSSENALSYSEEKNASVDIQLEELFVSLFINSGDGYFVLNEGNFIFDAFEDDSDVEMGIVGKPLNYPNPFSASTTGTSITYTLSKAGDIDIHIYSLRGTRVFSHSYLENQTGGEKGYNRVEIDQSRLMMLSPGPYLYVILHQGKVIGKNKLVVLP